jgi:glutathione synthase
MDPIGAINPRTDSTLVLGRQAQARGHELWYYTPDALTYCDGDITATARRVTFFDDEAHYYELGETASLNLRELDVVLLRQDPPFNMTYLSTTYLLEQLEPEVLVVNSPAGVRNLPEKIFPTLLREFMPPTMISADLAQIERFRAEHKDIIVKPLFGFGGRSVLRIAPGDENFAALLEMQFAGNKEPVMVQRFLPEVKTGDRRLIMVDGEIGGIMGRIPAEHEIRANFRVGGTAVPAKLTPKQREICAILGPLLKKHGLIFAGIDFIGDWLTEVNLTSPTGLAAMNRLYNNKLEAKIWDVIEAKVKA